MDVNKNGKLSPQEVIAGVEKYIGRPLTHAEILAGKKYFVKVMGADAQLNFEEFKKFAKDVAPILRKIMAEESGSSGSSGDSGSSDDEGPGEELKPIFNMLDTNHDGQLEGGEVVRGV